MIFNEIINNIVEDYLNAWNVKDVKKILGIFSENGSFESPLVQIVNHDNGDAKIIGKEKLEYFYKVLFNSPSYFSMDKLRIENQDKRVMAYVNDTTHHVILKSTFVINEYGKLQCLTITEE